MYRPGILALGLALLALPGTALASPLPTEPQDLEVSGEDVRIERGERVHDLRVFGGDLVVLGEVTGDLSAFGGDVELRGPVRGNVHLLGGDLRATSSIGGDLKMTGGDARIEGVVHGDVHMMGGDAKLAKDGKVVGKVYESGGLDLDDLSLSLPTPAWFKEIVPGVVSVTTALGMLVKLIAWSAAFVIGVLFLGADRLRFVTYQESLTLSSLPSLGWGALILTATTTLSGLCIVSVLGLPVAAFLMFALVAAMHAGLALTAASVGSVLPSTWLATRPWAQLCVGTALCAFASLVPWLGSLLMLLASVAGIGAVLVSHRKPRAPRGAPVTAMSIVQG